MHKLFQKSKDEEGLEIMINFNNKLNDAFQKLVKNDEMEKN